MSWVVKRGWFGMYWHVYEMMGMTGWDEEWHASFREKLEAECYAERRKVRSALLERANILSLRAPQ